MHHWRQPLIHGMNVFTVVIVSYFFVANGIYTLLMMVSLISAWLRHRRLAYQSLEEIRESTVTPPATIIMPAFNEEGIIVESVRSALQVDYPGLQVIVVDDGSKDRTLERLIRAFDLVKMDFIYRPRTAARTVRAFYFNQRLPNLLVIHKENGGKPDALNAGINMCRTPYFCTLDSDCMLERDALLRLIRPILYSRVKVVASGGVVRIANGCQVQDGRVVKVSLPASLLERFQVVEYLRSFLFGRTGWDLLRGTMIVSGAFALFHRETVIEAGGFGNETVAEDMDLILQLHRWAVDHKHEIRMAFALDPVCWTECPSSLRMLARQRRRWQLGLCQTLWKNSKMLFNRRYGVVGLLSFPFQLYVEGLGAAVEFLGYLMVPIVLALAIMPPPLFVLFVAVSLAYAGLLSVGAVLLEELTLRRYPGFRELRILLVLAFFENLGFRQLVVWFRFQAVVRFLAGSHQWEKVTHLGTTRLESGAEPDLRQEAS